MTTLAPPTTPAGRDRRRRRAARRAAGRRAHHRRGARHRRDLAARAGRRTPPGRPRCWPGPGCCCCRSRWPRPSPRSARATPTAAASRRTPARPSARRAATVVGWCFYFAIPIGAPTAAGFAGAYVADSLGGGRPTQLLATGGIIAPGRDDELVRPAGLRPGAAGDRRRARGAAAGRHRWSRSPTPTLDNLTPFAPHGWLAVGTAAALLVWAFAGWEAVTSLSAEYRNPARDIGRATGVAIAVIARPLPRRRVRHRRRARRAHQQGAALRPAGARLRRGGAPGHHGRRGAALGRRDERLLRRRRPARRRAGPRRLAAGLAGPRRRPPARCRAARSAVVTAGALASAGRDHRQRRHARGAAADDHRRLHPRLRRRHRRRAPAAAPRQLGAPRRRPRRSSPPWGCWS